MFSVCLPLGHIARPFIWICEILITHAYTPNKIMVHGAQNETIQMLRMPVVLEILSQTNNAAIAPLIQRKNKRNKSHLNHCWSNLDYLPTLYSLFYIHDKRWRSTFAFFAISLMLLLSLHDCLKNAIESDWKWNALGYQKQEILLAIFALHITREVFHFNFYSFFLVACNNSAFCRSNYRLAESLIIMLKRHLLGHVTVIHGIM